MQLTTRQMFEQARRKRVMAVFDQLSPLMRSHLQEVNMPPNFFVPELLEMPESVRWERLARYQAAVKAKELQRRMQCR